MGRKKRFDKKQGQTYHLVHKASKVSNEDYVVDPSDDGDFYLMPVKGTTKEFPTGGTIQNEKQKEKDNKKLTAAELLDHGVPDDGYDYSKHMKQMGTGHFVEALGLKKVKKEDVDIGVVDLRKKGLSEIPQALLEKLPPHLLPGSKDDDPTIVHSAEYGDGLDIDIENEFHRVDMLADEQMVEDDLDDEFMTLANGRKKVEGQDQEDDNDDEWEDIDDDDMFSDGDGEDSGSEYSDMVEEVEEEEVDIDALMAAAPFLGGAGMNFHKALALGDSRDVSRTNEFEQTMNDEFDELLENEYRDEDIGYLSESDERITAGTTKDMSAFDHVFDQYLSDEQNKKGTYEAQMDDFTRETAHREIARFSQSKIERLNKKEEEKALRREQLKKEKQLKEAEAQAVPESVTEKTEAPKLTFAALAQASAPAARMKKKTVWYDPLKDNIPQNQGQQWDCETIITTYTNTENHPRIIDTRKPRKKIELDKQGVPVGYGRTVKEESESESDLDELDDDLIIVNKGEKREKKEDKSDKKERKAQLKAEKREARSRKKQTKAMFKEVELEQTKRNAATSKMSVIGM